MKKILLFFSFGLLTFFVLATKPHTDHVNIDVDNSEIKWKGSKIYKSHEGVVNINKGVLLINHGRLIGGSISIDMQSIICTDIQDEEKNNSLVGHLKNEDFFDVGNFPESQINIIKVDVSTSDKEKYNIVADLTIKGVTHPIQFEAYVQMRGSVNFIIKSKIIIDRTKWGIEYGSGNIFKELGDRAILDDIEFNILLVSKKSK